MKDKIIENALIKSTMLGEEDHGIFTAYVTLGGESWGQGFGGYAFDSYNRDAGKRLAINGYGIEFIKGVLAAAGVSSWEKLPGRYVRIEREGYGGKITRIGHITDNVWFDPQELRP